MEVTQGWKRASISLASWSNDPQVAAMAAGVCYDAKNPQKALEHAVNSGHESVLEHVTYTFRIRNISRACLTQLTRHRIASYSVRSQRYTNQEGTEVVCPQTVQDNVDMMLMWHKTVAACKALYQSLIDVGIPKEDARYILPEGTETELYVTMNARELRHFFSLRCCNRAQWEIRSVADTMLNLVRTVTPELFSYAGPGCARGKCPEARPCGHPRYGT